MAVESNQSLESDTNAQFAQISITVKIARTLENMFILSLNIKSLYLRFKGVAHMSISINQKSQRLKNLLRLK